MKKKWLIGLLWINIFANAQNFTIVDSRKKAIPNVKAISENGEIVGISDLNGFLKISNSNFEKLELFHTNYNSDFLTPKSAKDSVILQDLKINNIDEVVIKKQAKKYLNLYAYFISYQLIDGNPQSYNDGIIVYTLNAKTQKLKKEKIIKQRLLKNVDFLNQFYTKNPNRTFSVGSDIRPLTFYEELINLGDVKSENGDIKVREKDFRIDKNKNLSIDIEYNSPEHTKKQALFGLKSEITNHSVTEIFKNQNLDLKDLKSIAKYYKSKISQKDFSYNYELVQNIYIIKPEYNDNDEIIFDTKNDFQNLIPDNIKYLINEKILR